MWPKLVINLTKLEHNTKVINQLINNLGGTMFAVTKVVGGDPTCAKALLAGGAQGLADSRLINIKKLRQAGIAVPILLLRSPALSEIQEVIDLVDISLNSDITVLQALNSEAGRRGKIHQVILMVDLGDGREGVVPEQLGRLVQFTRQLENISICGIGTNLACLGTALPTPENMEVLLKIYQQFDDGSIPYLSGCNSSSLNLVVTGQWHQKLNAVNHWRIGESIFFGWDIITKQTLPGCLRDVCTLEVEVIEVKEQSSLTKVVFAVGLEEIGSGKVFPKNTDLTIVGISSDHLVAVSKTGHMIEVGSIIPFTLDYQSLLASANSQYVQIEYVD